MPALTSQTEIAKAGIRHLGYPEYFGTMLTVFKVAGAIVLMVPMIKGRLKDWAYAGLAIDFIAASISTWAVDGFGGAVLFPVGAFVLLVVSYISFMKLNPASPRPII